MFSAGVSNVRDGVKSLGIEIRFLPIPIPSVRTLPPPGPRLHLLSGSVSPDYSGKVKNDPRHA